MAKSLLHPDFGNCNGLYVFCVHDLFADFSRGQSVLSVFELPRCGCNLLIDGGLHIRQQRVMSSHPTIVRLDLRA